MPIATADFEFVREMVRSKSGIVLEPGKEYLVDARLSALARREKLDSIEALVARVRTSPADPIGQRVIEAMTTNETSFFRDIHPFEAFKKSLLPSILAEKGGTKTLNIWCGAASTGQEPYTVAMILREAIPDIDTWKLTFIATDISSEMVARCKAGIFNQIEVNRGLPATLLVKYFQKTGLEWKIDDKLRALIDFRELNLTRPWASMPAMDVVFLRNVLIYFDPATKKDILARVRTQLRPRGYLFLGCAETTMGIDDGFERVQIDKSGCYRVK